MTDRSRELLPQSDAKGYDASSGSDEPEGRAGSRDGCPWVNMRPGSAGCRPGEPAEEERLLSPSFLTRLELLKVLIKQRVLGRTIGERLSRRRGSSVEFAEYRDYAEGDDLRYLDWNLLARLDRPLTKTFYEEEDLDLVLFIDTSMSMGFGRPGKLGCARRIVAALAYLGLASLDRVSIVPISGAPERTFGPARGREAVFEAFAHLSKLSPDDETPLGATLSRVAFSAPRAGVAVVVSDLMDPAGFQDGLSRLFARGFALHVLHVLDRSERTPDLDGDLKLVDCETGVEQEVSLSPRIIERYRQIVEAFVDEVASFCNRRGASYLLIDTATPVEDVVLKLLRQARIVG